MNEAAAEPCHAAGHGAHAGACRGVSVAPRGSDGLLIALRGVRFVRDGRAILDGVDVEIRAGEIVTLIGPNGAGKTTLVKVLVGLTRPDAGEIWRGTGVRIGYVPQRMDVDRALPLTVEGFLRLGLEVSQAQLREALADVGAEHVAVRQMSRLSGGEVQRVLMARALLRRPSLLVLDEPVRGVDLAGEAELYGLIARIRDRLGTGVLLVSHDLHVVMASSDRVICLNRHVCCSGVPETVAAHPEYVRLFGVEAGKALAVYHHSHDHEHDCVSGVPGAAGVAKAERGDA